MLWNGDILLSSICGEDTELMKDVVAVEAGEYKLDGNMLAKAAIAPIDRWLNTVLSVATCGERAVIALTAVASVR